MVSVAAVVFRSAIQEGSNCESIKLPSFEAWCVKNHRTGSWIFQASVCVCSGSVGGGQTCGPGLQHTLWRNGVCDRGV